MIIAININMKLSKLVLLCEMHFSNILFIYKKTVRLFIPPMLVVSIKHNHNCNHIQYLNSDAFKYKCFVRHYILEHHSLPSGN